MVEIFDVFQLGLDLDSYHWNQCMADIPLQYLTPLLRAVQDLENRKMALDARQEGLE
jgi:hypothetical protein